MLCMMNRHAIDRRSPGRNRAPDSAPAARGGPRSLERDDGGRTGGAIHWWHRAATRVLAATHDVDRRLARPWIRDVFRDRKRERTMDRTSRTLATGGLAGNRDWMGDRSRSVGSRLRLGRGGRGDELGVRHPGMD